VRDASLVVPVGVFVLRCEKEIGGYSRASVGAVSPNAVGALEQRTLAINQTFEFFRIWKLSTVRSSTRPQVSSKSAKQRRIGSLKQAPVPLPEVACDILERLATGDSDEPKSGTATLRFVKREGDWKLEHLQLPQDLPE
jgi:hypothetical protein